MSDVCGFCGGEVIEPTCEASVDWYSSEEDAILLKHIIESTSVLVCEECQPPHLVDGPTMRIRISYEMVEHWEEMPEN